MTTKERPQDRWYEKNKSKAVRYSMKSSAKKYATQEATVEELKELIGWAQERLLKLEAEENATKQEEI